MVSLDRGLFIVWPEPTCTSVRDLSGLCLGELGWRLGDRRYQIARVETYRFLVLACSSGVVVDGAFLFLGVVPSLKVHGCF